jgi:FKBP-type peptidyl-prolyl cis-trans isomerase SlyD
MTDLTVAPGRVVSFTYLIRDDETGEIREYRDLPYSYVHGTGSGMIPKIAQALESCRSGDQVSVTLSAEEGFGSHDPNLTFTDELENVPPELRFVGAELEAESESGERRQFRVTRIADGKLTVDGNHPFAGRRLRYEITVTGVRDATPEETRSGVVADSAPRL